MWLGDSDSNRDCTAPKAGGLPITPSPINWALSSLVVPGRRFTFRLGSDEMRPMFIDLRSRNLRYRKDMTGTLQRVPTRAVVDDGAKPIFGLALPAVVGDKSANVWPLAILSMGESWHSLHHADPTCARHGVLPGQIDSSARLIWLFEKFGWVRDVRWPDPVRLASRRVAPSNP